MSRSGSAQVEVASLSDVGRTRSENQDSCGEFSDASGRRLLVVADGMGGHQGGQTASRIAVETVGRVFGESLDGPKELLRSALRSASHKIFETAANDIHLRGMGTTGVLLLLDGDAEAWVAHVGDSRLYRLRDGRLEALTDDHSLLFRLIEEEGLSLEEASNHPGSHVLERAVGPDPDVEVDVAPVSVLPGDVFLLCSDGLWGEVPDADIAQMLSGRNLSEVARSLVSEANRNGGGDNITVSLARMGGPPAADPGGDRAGDRTVGLGEVPDDSDLQGSDAESAAPAETAAAPRSATGATAGALWLALILVLLLLVALGALWWTRREATAPVAPASPTSAASPASAEEGAR